MIAAWLHAKEQRTGSLDTPRRYGDDMAHFRRLLHNYNLELTSTP